MMTFRSNAGLATSRHRTALVAMLTALLLTAGCGGAQQDGIDPDVATVLARRQAHATATTIQGQATATTSAQLTATADADPYRAIVEVVDWRVIQQDIFARKLVGEVRNSGGGPAKDVAVTAVLLDSAGTELGRKTTAPTGVLPDIPAGESSPFTIELDPVVYDTIADVRIDVHFESGLGEEWARPEVSVDTWNSDDVVVKVTNTEDRVVRYVRALVIGYDDAGKVVDVIGARERYITWNVLPGGALGSGSTETFTVDATAGVPIPARTAGVAWANTCASAYTCY